MKNLENDKIRQEVRKTYANVATGSATIEAQNCCGDDNDTSCCSGVNVAPDIVSMNLGYSKDEVIGVP